MDTPRRIMTMIGAAAVLLMAGWCAYNLLAGWPSQYKGGILYDRMVQKHVTGRLLQAACQPRRPSQVASAGSRNRGASQHSLWVSERKTKRNRKGT